MAERPPQPADVDNAKAQQRRHFAWWQAGVGLVAFGLLVVLLGVCVLWGPRWLYPSLTNTDLKDVHAQNLSDAAKVQELKEARLKLQNDARTTLLQGLGGLLVLVGAAIGASVTFRQVRATRDQIAETTTASRNQLRLSEHGQVTDRYTKAIDQLDANKALSVRLGGLYALERIAHDSRDDRATIAEVLCAYIRTASRPEPPTDRPRLPLVRAKDTNPIAETSPAWSAAADPASLAVRAPDVQAAMTILGRWQKRLNERPPVLDLHNADLQGVNLCGAQLQGADLSRAQLQGADLSGAQLQGASLYAAQLQDADLSGAELRGADVRDAYLRGGCLRAAQLQEATLSGSQLQDANLYAAQLQGARLLAVQLRGAELSGAQLQGANLFLAELQGAKASEATSWPDGWSRAEATAAGVEFVDFPLPKEIHLRWPDEPVPPGEE